MKSGGSIALLFGRVDAFCRLILTKSGDGVGFLFMSFCIV